MQLTSQILAFGRICYAIKQYMQLSNMQLTVQFSYWMAGIGSWFLKVYAIIQYAIKWYGLYTIYRRGSLK